PSVLRHDLKRPCTRSRVAGLPDASALWLAPYEEPRVRWRVRALWQRLRPLYEELHAHVRQRLRAHFGAAAAPRRAPLPAHLLGPPPAQAWGRAAPLAQPFPHRPRPDIAAAMRKQADRFAQSLGLAAAPAELWRRSLFARPAPPRRVLCHASAWDFFDGRDVRVKACAAPSLDDLAVAAHEMGHVQYFLQYARLPLAFREAANPGAPCGARTGFHEAVGDVLALGVTGEPHLRRLGLLPPEGAGAEGAGSGAWEAQLNLLMEAALERVPLLPVALALEHWRWDTFQQRARPRHARAAAPLLRRRKYAGVGPPVERSDEDFDPGAKYHVAAGAPYLQYFVSGVLQFQLFRSLCVAAGQFDPRLPSKRPLFLCDLYSNASAGDKLGAMMQLGSSVAWPEALAAATGGAERALDAQGVLDYFAPLLQWLRAENQRTGEPLGWRAGAADKALR
ncbi:Angiotensin-converting enzyme, partial [Gryllus bimaculatus]